MDFLDRETWGILSLDIDVNLLRQGTGAAAIEGQRRMFQDTTTCSSKFYCTSSFLITLWLFNIAMENGPFIDDFPIKTSIYEGFSMAMLNNQRVTILVFLFMW